MGAIDYRMDSNESVKMLQPFDIKHNLVIIKINRSYNSSLSARELYEYTRGFWKNTIEYVRPAQYALAVANGEVVEVYKIIEWVKAKDADNMIRTYDPQKHSDRIAFNGEVAASEVRDYYLGRHVDSLYKNGEANPVKLFTPNSADIGEKNGDRTMAKQYEILDASQNIQFHTIVSAINDILGTSYTGWQRATWPSNYGNGRFRMWFPKLAETKNGELVAASFDCVNTLSDDWNEFVFDDLKNTPYDVTKEYNGYDLIFAKDPDGGDYLFRGVYIRDVEKSRPYHYVNKRIATKVRLIGDPVYDIELLDEVSTVEAGSNINVPMNPQAIKRLQYGTLQYVCGRCGAEFKKAPRCPECGQLVKE